MIVTPNIIYQWDTDRTIKFNIDAYLASFGYRYESRKVAEKNDDETFNIPQALLTRSGILYVYAINEFEDIIDSSIIKVVHTGNPDTYIVSDTPATVESYVKNMLHNIMLNIPLSLLQPMTGKAM